MRLLGSRDLTDDVNAKAKHQLLTSDSGGNLVETSEGMSELFNEAFGKVFTKENNNNNNDHLTAFDPGQPG